MVFEVRVWGRDKGFFVGIGMSFYIYKYLP